MYKVCDVYAGYKDKATETCQLSLLTSTVAHLDLIITLAHLTAC